MGCDIHIVIQVQEPDGWHEVVYQEDFTDINLPLVSGVLICPTVFRRRNYDLFGILADVRNRAGWRPIAANRGLPLDFNLATIAPQVRYPDEGPRDLGDHSFTWVTLDELRAWPWNDEQAVLSGVVPAVTYAQCLATGKSPRVYAQDVSGPGIQIYTPEQFTAPDVVLSLRPYVRMPWTETAREASGDWPGIVLPWLETVAQGRPLRLVMGFDN